ncbi:MULTISPECIES: restriction endonuclease subunit S [Bacillus]|uniref:restriction endonuclease subunit S n=1 Tax=Bacillus TaxID=1386 RepID=UPI0015A10220|nr:MULTISPECIES: restriction endonuclease subunit S [Bacillus]MCY7468634.1 restriction endonuclease subunit S [Bacillus safensis]NWF41952.1 hypothetical protein [Bacillus sp. 8A6]
MRNKLWPKKKISWLFDVIGSGTTPSASNEMYYDSPDMAWLNTGDLTDSYIEKTSKYVSQQALDKFSALTIFPKDSLVMAMYGATIGKLGITKYETTTNQACCVLSKPRGVITKFIFYWLMGHRTEIINLSHGGGQPNISQGIIRNIRIAIPPLELQSKIVTFVDKKFEETNQLINKKEKMIKLLELQRQSIITEAVTKGLNPNVKMKDSGVEWIGEIPEHWGTKKIKYLIQEKLLYGANESAELDDEKLPRYIRITDIDELGNLKNETFKSIPLDIANKYVVKKGDILLARSGATVGKSYIHKEEKEASYAGYLIKLRVRTLELAEYIYYFTNSSLYKQWINSILIQATIQNVSAEKYANLSIPVPNDENEIKSILLNIKFKEKEILEVINKLKEQIEKLKEYRQSLIYEAVTGKIDVRDMELDEVR